MKHVLITGGCGFVGHHVVQYLLNNTDWNITILDRLDFSGNQNRLYETLGWEYNDRLNLVFHDLKAEVNLGVKNAIWYKFNKYPQIILHLAAGSHVDRSITHPLEFVYDNVVGTANILEYARHLHEKTHFEKFLYFSTDEVFGPAPTGVAYKELDRYNSSNPYSATKAGGEELCVAYENTYKMPIIITHTMNVFGERQTPEKFIPLCIGKVNRNEKVSIHADSTRTVPSSRYYTYAGDVAEALLFLLTNNFHHLKYNIVGKEETDNLTLARMVAQAQGKLIKYELVDFHSSRPGHDLRYALDGGLMKELGWEPKVSIQDRIKQVSDWYLANPKWLEF